MEEIKKLVDDEINAGANPTEVSFSSKACMLLELGLRVYKIRQSEQVDSGRDDFDKLLLKASLESMFFSQFLAAKLGNMEKSEKDSLRASIDRKVAKEMEPFFPAMDDEG